MYLPGYDALRSRNTHPDIRLDFNQLGNYSHEAYHKTYLQNEAYREYLAMPKGFTNETNAPNLIRLADELRLLDLPRYSDAAGWAYAEAALTMESEPAVNRVALLSEAERTWERSLHQTDELSQSSAGEWLYEDSTPFRTAMNIAYAPVMKSLVVGNVTKGIREKTFKDTLAVAQAALIQQSLSLQEGNMEAVGDLSGFLHESNALLSLLYLDDARYVPLPSSARADSGYFHGQQAHDITIINQHWGTIRKVIPMEVKAAASMRDRSRYRALIIRGKMHLGVPGKYSPQYTLDAFASVNEHTGSIEQQRIVDHASMTVKRLLELYQKGGRHEEDEAGVTTFYNNQKVMPHYSETRKK